MNFWPTGDFEREAKRRFPDDRWVQLESPTSVLQRFEFLRSLNKKDSNSQLKFIEQKWKDDPVAISVILRAYLDSLKQNRIEGVLTNPGGPGAPVEKAPESQSPRAAWNRFLVLAKRGQKLEPDNTFFDWMLLYGLYATRQDEEARQVLKLAARKTRFDDHSRDLILHRLALMRLVYGAPLSPHDCYAAWNFITFPEYGKMRQTARWVMEGAIADREANRHTRALNAAVDLAKLGRLMRRQSHSLIGSLVARAVQDIAIQSSRAPLPLGPGGVVRPRILRQGAPLAAYQASPISLYAYAREQKRLDILAFLNGEWPELGKWRALSGVILNQDWTGNSTSETVFLTASERLRALVLRALPSILVLGAIFALLSKRFRDDSGALLGGFWRGALCCAVVFALALAFDAIVVMRDDNAWSDWSSYLDDRGLLSVTPFWVALGIAFVPVSLAIHAAIGWQKRQNGEEKSLKTRFKTLFEAPEDGLMRFDFGWVFGLIAKGTAWILLLGAFTLLCFKSEELLPAFGVDLNTSGAGLMTVAIWISLVLHVGPWRIKPRRRQTFRLGLRLISQSLLGFFVASSVMYALAAFAFLPLAFRFERNFQSAMERGEVQIARAKLGL